MHIKSLKVFCDVVGKRSFSRAADDNGISQSGASQMVHQLEEELGVKLLDRSKRPFVLTPEGKAYYDGCRPLVHRLYALEEEVRTLHQEVAGRVAVASIYSIGLSHLNDLASAFRTRHPKANLHVEYHHPDRVYELVDQDQVDLGLVSFPRSSRTLKAYPWLEEPVLLVAAPGHPLVGRGDLSCRDLHGLELIGFDQDLKVRHHFDRELGQLGVEPRVVMEFDNIETIKSAIRVNRGISLLPEPTVRSELAGGLLIELPVPGLRLTRPIGVIRRRGVELGKTARRFIQTLQPPTESAIEDEDPAAVGVREPAPTSRD